MKIVTKNQKIMPVVVAADAVDVERPLVVLATMDRLDLALVGVGTVAVGVVRGVEVLEST